MGDLFYGWTYEQWALALAGKSPSTLIEAIDIKREYIKNHKISPIEKGVIITNSGKDERPRNYDAANAIERMIFETMYGRK